MRLIDVDALIEKCGDWYVEEGPEEGFIGTLKSLLDEQPTVDAEPVRHGRWIKMTGMMPPEFTGHFECDNCGWHGKLNERETDCNFCPGCGAKMSVGFPSFDGDDCKSTPFDEILGDYLKKINNENEKEK